MGLDRTPQQETTTAGNFITDSRSEEPAFKAERTSPEAGLTFQVRSLSTVSHAATFNMAATGGVGSAVNAVSSNSNFTCLQVTGHETNKGTVKISHVNASGAASGDNGAAAVSIDLQGGAEGGTAAQGVFMTSTTGSNTGPWLTVRNEAKELLARLKAEGALELKELTNAPSVEAGCYALYVKGGALFLKLGAAAAVQITVP